MQRMDSFQENGTPMTHTIVNNSRLLALYMDIRCYDNEIRKVLERYKMHLIMKERRSSKGKQIVHSQGTEQAAGSDIDFRLSEGQAKS
mmetsp:Transcript_21769/g.33621  ORF Transcript_21769/g.33621 Transcript_21769/m.33621 type:complete len:88 (+) Transcript_21769:1244-1507(+)